MMFPRETTTSGLMAIGARHRDLKWATRRWHAGNPYRAGQVLQFWTEDDPRSESGVLMLAKYVCTQSGADDATWKKVSIEKGVQVA